MKKFIMKPSIDMFPGIVVTKDTELTFKNDFVSQSIKDLQFHSVEKVEGEGFRSTRETWIDLQEGDVLLLESEKRGYIKPVQDFVTVEEAIEELMCIKEVGGVKDVPN